MSLDWDKIDDFGTTLYRALRDKIESAGHAVVEHNALMAHLSALAASSEKEERVRAIRAKLYARRRREGLIEWKFKITRVDRKTLITWAFNKIQQYFAKM